MSCDGRQVTAAATTTGATTAEVLVWLRRTRGQRRRKLGKAAYAGYIVGLVVVLYGYPVFDWARRALGETQLRTDTGPVVSRSVLPAVAGLVLVAIGVFIRNARWRGPVVVAAADVGWLLPQPLERGRVLRPRLFITTVITALSGALLGLLGAATLHALRPATGVALVVIFPVDVCARGRARCVAGAARRGITPTRATQSAVVGGPADARCRVARRGRDLGVER